MLVLLVMIWILDYEFAFENEKSLHTLDGIRFEISMQSATGIRSQNSKW